MLERFGRLLQTSRLIQPGDKLLVGYSGGADSTCMLHLMHRSGIDIVAAHLHHSQRPEADVEQRMCEQLCASLDIPFVAGKADVPLIARQQGIGLEEAGRNARYEFYRKASLSLGCNKVATAHTRDDSAEWVLLNITRGCGIGGLRGIPERRELIIRPMLEFTRSETRAYCVEHDLPFHDDPANFDIDLSRARVRHRVIPELQSINLSVLDAISRLSSVAREEDDYLNAQAVHALAGCEIPLNGALRFLSLGLEASFERPALSMLPPVLLRRAFLLVSRALEGELNAHQIQALLDGLSQQERGSITGERGSVVIEWDAQSVHFRAPEDGEPFRYPLEAPGVTESPSFGWQIEVWQSDESAFHRFDRDSLEVTIDASQIKGPLYLRSLEPGDSLAPMGFDQPRKASELVREAHLTQTARRRLPIICDILGVVWVPGVTPANRVKATEATNSKLRFRFGPLETSG